MINLPENIKSLSEKYGFTRSAKYDQAWMFENAMGPVPVWLLEWLLEKMTIDKDMAVLDMGCGKAITSIFLAKEVGCTVFANDLWIPADENLKRIEAFSLNKKVFPVYAEAHAMPYAHDFFDAITCIDAYQYFGTDDSYLGYFSKFVKPGGRIGIVVPGWARERLQFQSPFPNIESWEFASFHSRDWWVEHLSGSGPVEIENADIMSNGKSIWLDSGRALQETKRLVMTANGAPPEKIREEVDFWQNDIDFIEQDTEDYVALIRVVMKRK